jgi:hypothetical protein
MRRFFHVLAAGFLLGAMTVTARAADLNLEARLIWGANAETNAVNVEPLDPQLSEKLHHAFKWLNYYQITNKLANIPLGHSRDLKMSDSCTIRVKNLGSSRVEVSCIGRGKPVHKGNYALVPPQWLVLGGSSTDDTAWLVVLRSVDKKTAGATARN